MRRIFAHLIRITPAVVIALAAPVAAHAQTASHYDGGMNGWTTQTIVNPYGCASGAGGTVATGGNPGSHWGFSNYDCYTLVFNAHVSTFSWNPMSQGAITGNLTFGYDISTSSGGQIAFENVLRQGNKWFVSGYNLATYGLGWESVTSTPTAWCEVFAGFGPSNSYTCGGGLPDFSAAGGQIDFGVVSANSGSGLRYGGIDNFSVSFDHSAPASTVPEPVSMSLVATGLAGLALVTRRRRNR